MSSSSRSSGNLTADGIVVTGQCKLVSIHGINLHATDMTVIVVYDNTAASGKVVAKMAIPGLTSAGSDQSGATVNPTATSMEYDMHGVLCRNGLYIDVTNGTPHVTIEYA